MTEQIKPFHYTAFPRIDDKKADVKTPEATLESIIKQRFGWNANMSG